MLLELAVGDAYGSSFEFASKKFVEEFNTLQKYYQHPRFKNNGDNMYTDDTQQSIAISESVILHNEWTKELVADKMVEVFKRDERPGYTSGFFNILKQVENGKELLEKIHGNSEKCGAAMRAMPIGVLSNIWEVISKSYIQATITHNSHDGIESSIASSLMAHYFIYNIGPKKELPDFLRCYNKNLWEKPWRGEKVSTNGIECVHAALTMVIKYNNMADILNGCVSCLGDTDSVASIALAVASNSNEIEQNLPQILVDDLENGDYGKDYLINLDNVLFKLKGRERF